MNIAAAVLVSAAVAAGSLPVEGIVQDAEGRPVEKALIFYYSSGIFGTPVEPGARALSGNSGRFAVADPDEQPIFLDTGRVLLAFKPGAGIAAVQFDSRRPPSQTIPLRLRPTRQTRIRVVDPDGSPVAEAKVKVDSFGADRDSLWAVGISTAHFEKTTDAEGHVAFDVLPPEVPFSVRVDTLRFGGQRFAFEGVPEEQTARLSPVGKLSGQVQLDDPRLAAGLPIRVRSSPSKGAAGSRSSGIAETRIDADGRFEIAALAAGEVWIHSLPASVDSPYLLTTDQRFPLLPGKAVHVELKCVRGIRVTGNALDEETQQPVAGVRLMAAWQSPLDQGISRMWYSAVLSNENGEFGWYTLPGFVQFVFEGSRGPFVLDLPYDGSVKLDPQAPGYDFGPLRMRRGVPLSGTVVDEQSRPVPHAAVEALWRVSGATRAMMSRAAVFADDRGRFRIEGVTDRSPVELTARDDFRGSLEQLVVDPSVVRKIGAIDLLIHPDGLFDFSGRVVDGDGKPIAGARLDIWATPLDSAEQPWPQGWTLFTGQDVLTDKNGGYRLARVLPLTRYSINAFISGYSGLPLEARMLRRPETTLRIFS